MTDTLIVQKLVSTLRECSTHLMRMSYAHKKISVFMPVSAKTLPCLSDEDVEALDQYIFRFSKLQDTMGERLFRQMLERLAEDVRGMAFIDKLNRLEQLGMLRSTDEWLAMRQLRNLLAHEYDDNQEQLAEIINLVFSKFEDIKQIFDTADQHIQPYL